MVQIPMNVAGDLPPHDERLQTVDADRLIGGVWMFHYTGLSSGLKVTLCLLSLCCSHVFYEKNRIFWFLAV